MGRIGDEHSIPRIEVQAGRQWKGNGPHATVLDGDDHTICTDYLRP